MLLLFDLISRLIDCSVRPCFPSFPPRRFIRWRVFYIAVEELFAYSDGEEWGVSMYRFVK